MFTGRVHGHRSTDGTGKVCTETTAIVESHKANYSEQ